MALLNEHLAKEINPDGFQFERSVHYHMSDIENYYFVYQLAKKKSNPNEVDAKKPDHQHGDILGIQAMANGQVISPNYQTRYSLTDFDFFKNSMVKNVALVDNEL